MSIFNQLNEGFERFALECSDCDGTKGQVGMEGPQNTSITQTAGTNVAVQSGSEENGKYILTDGPVSTLFTKALQVRFANDDQNNELNHKRPVEEVNAATESAAQDFLIQTSKINGGSLSNVRELNISRIAISNTDKNPVNVTNVNTANVLSSLLNNSSMTEFIFVKSGGVDGKTDELFIENWREGVNKIKEKGPGRVEGQIANESLNIQSVQVIVTYK